MYAGTDTVLVSLWSVADESTYKPMVDFLTGWEEWQGQNDSSKNAKARAIQRL